VIVVLAVLAATSWVGVTGASAGRLDPPGHRDANHCVNPAGVDLNELYGVSTQFFSAFCQGITAGESSIRLFAWFTDDGVDSVYPDGYLPSRPAPLDDFVAKLVSAKIMIDGGTSQEFTVTYRPNNVLRTDINLAQLNPAAPPFPMASLLLRVNPLSVGGHTSQLFIVLSAEHCDGLGTDRAFNCLPAGETPLGPPRPFTVIVPET
jgi:hypothetical protein